MIVELPFELSFFAINIEKKVCGVLELGCSHINKKHNKCNACLVFHI